jgi:hypothetical protein
MTSRSSFVRCAVKRALNGGRRLALAVMVIIPLGGTQVCADEVYWTVWTVQEISGSVALRQPGMADRQPIVGTQIPDGAMLVAGDNGHATLTKGGDTVRLFPASALEFPAPEKGGAFTRLVQSVGTAVYDVETRPSWGFQVDTPYLATMVKGTSFRVSVLGSGAEVAVTEGVVNVSSGTGGAVDVPAGHSASVSRTAAEIDVRSTADVAPGEGQSPTGAASAADAATGASSGTSLSAAAVSAASKQPQAQTKPAVGAGSLLGSVSMTSANSDNLNAGGGETRGSGNRERGTRAGGARGSNGGSAVSRASGQVGTVVGKASGGQISGAVGGVIGGANGTTGSLGETAGQLGGTFAGTGGGAARGFGNGTDGDVASLDGTSSGGSTPTSGSSTGSSSTGGGTTTSGTGGGLLGGIVGGVTKTVGGAVGGLRIK